MCNYCVDICDKSKRTCVKRNIFIEPLKVVDKPSKLTFIYALVTEFQYSVYPISITYIDNGYKIFK